MHAGRHYSLREVLTWTRRETLLFLLWAAVPPGLLAAGVPVPPAPWPLIGLIGTAVAFVTGFKGNAAYGRLWEARQIWGAIVNWSRSWTLQVKHLIAGPAGGTGGAGGESLDEPTRALVLGHLAWMTALRHQLREPRAWESQTQVHNVEYRARTYSVAETAAACEADLAQLLDSAVLARVGKKKNRATHLLDLQGQRLRRLRDEGRLTELGFLELTRTLVQLYEQQGKCERIKNFPYPRQFATLNRIFVWLFILLLPFGLLAEFSKLGPLLVWATVPTTVLAAWVFHTMDKIGEATENPFEGGPNDVPITAMSRTIEIDLREMIDDPAVPAALQPVQQILM